MCSATSLSGENKDVNTVVDANMMTSLVEPYLLFVKNIRRYLITSNKNILLVYGIN